jgi:hypothetical protein
MVSSKVVSKDKVTQQSHETSTFGNIVVLWLLFLPESLMCFFMQVSSIHHKINLYYSGMILIPILFVIASGSVGAYASLLRNLYQRLSWRSGAKAIGTLIFGFGIQNLIFFVILHRTEWNVWHFGVTPWRDMGNEVFLVVNPAMETLFWRVFLHRELAVRWFPSKSQSDEKLLHLTTGTPILPRLSSVGTLVNAAAFSVYHYVPLMFFDLPLYSHAGMTYDMALMFLCWLFVLGIVAVHVREKLGILAAWTLHLGVDIADVMMYTYMMLKMTGHPTNQLFKSWE